MDDARKEVIGAISELGLCVKYLMSLDTTQFRDIANSIVSVLLDKMKKLAEDLE